MKIIQKKKKNYKIYIKLVLHPIIYIYIYIFFLGIGKVVWGSGSGEKRSGECECVLEQLFSSPAQSKFQCSPLLKIPVQPWKKSLQCKMMICLRKIPVQCAENSSATLEKQVHKSTVQIPEIQSKFQCSAEKYRCKIQCVRAVQRGARRGARRRAARRGARRAARTRMRARAAPRAPLHRTGFCNDFFQLLQRFFYFATIFFLQRFFSALHWNLDWISGIWIWTGCLLAFSALHAARCTGIFSALALDWIFACIATIFPGLHWNFQWAALEFRLRCTRKQLLYITHSPLLRTSFLFSRHFHFIKPHPPYIIFLFLYFYCELEHAIYKYNMFVFYFYCIFIFFEFCFWWAYWGGVSTRV